MPFHLGIQQPVQYYLQPISITYPGLDTDKYVEVFKQLVGDEGIWIRTKSSNLKERNITLLRGLFFVDALTHGNRTKFTQLTLFPSGDNENPKNSRITVNLYG